MKLPLPLEAKASCENDALLDNCENEDDTEINATLELKAVLAEATNDAVFALKATDELSAHDDVPTRLPEKLPVNDPLPLDAKASCENDALLASCENDEETEVKETLELKAVLADATNDAVFALNDTEELSAQDAVPTKLPENEPVKLPLPLEAKASEANEALVTKPNKKLAVFAIIATLELIAYEAVVILPENEPVNEPLPRDAKASCANEALLAN